MNVGRMNVGLTSRQRPNFNHITGAGARAWLAGAAQTGLVFDWSGGDPRFNHWLRGRRFSSVSGGAMLPSVDFIRAGTRTAGGVTFGPNVDRSVPGLGFRSSNGATNEIRQSDVMATQSFTVTAVPWTLSFTGTGSIALSGAFTGTLNGTGATNRVALTFTPTAASLTMTVTGDVRLAQLETGDFASDYVPNPNAGAGATAAADSLAAVASALPTSRMLIVVQTPFAVSTPSTVQRLWSWFTPNLLATRGASSVTISGGTESITLSGLSGRQRIAYLYEPGVAGRASANGAAVVVSTGVGPSVPTGGFAVAGNAGTAQLNDWTEWLAIAPVSGTLSDAQLQDIASLT